MNKLLVRTLSGAVFVLVTVGFFFLRLIDSRLFDIYTAFIMVVGSYELSSKLFFKKPVREGEEQTESVFAEKLIFIVSMLSALLVVPAYDVFGVVTAVSVILAEIFVNAFIVLFAKLGKNTFLKTLLSAIYPKVLVSALLIANSLCANSLLALVLIFVVAPATDTFAYLVGCSLKGPKLCPKISPKKTVEGAIGGVLFCVVATVLFGFIIEKFFNPDGAISANYLVLAVSGVFVSVVSQTGDLIMSVIKRHYGIKDYGKLFPGHGGMLDRFDSVLAVSLILAVICTYFELIPSVVV